MRPGQNKRSRGRNGGGHGGGPHHNRGPRPPHRIQTFDSNGPNVKIRGNAYQVFERYLALAREAQASGDPVAAENFYQHAEHYYRVMNAAGDGHQHGLPRPMTPADTETGGAGEAGQGNERHQVEVQVHAPMPAQPQMPVEQPAEEPRPYHDEQPAEEPRPYHDEQPPGF
jgi:hypothetical protein